RGAAGEPRTRYCAQGGLRDLLGLYPALLALAVLCLCLRVRRLPGELALCGLRTGGGRVCRALPCHAAAGGTKHHSELLKPFGLDARDPGFWEGGLRIIERMIGELEELEQFGLPLECRMLPLYIC